MAALGVSLPALVLLSSIWNRTEYLAHGYAIPVVSALLAYGKRAELKRALTTPSAPALGPLAVLGAAGFEALAVIGDMGFAAGVGIPLLLAAVAYAVGGHALLRPLALPLGFLLLMVPPPRSLTYDILFRLKLAVTELAVRTMQLAGHTGRLGWQSDPASWEHALRCRRLQRSQLDCFAPPACLHRRLLPQPRRVAASGCRRQRGSARGRSKPGPRHRHIAARRQARGRVRPGAPSRGLGADDLCGRHARPHRSGEGIAMIRLRLLASFVLLLATALTLGWLRYEGSHSRGLLAQFPLPPRIDRWVAAQDKEFDEQVLSEIDADSYAMRFYQAGGDTGVWVYVGMYGGRSGYARGAHDPEVCFPAQGSRGGSQFVICGRPPRRRPDPQQAPPGAAHQRGADRAVLVPARRALAEWRGCRAGPPDARRGLGQTPVRVRSYLRGPGR